MALTRSAVSRAAAAPVPKAKIQIPAIRAVERERLLGSLAPVQDHRLILVTAPAGSGKTTLLAQVAAAAKVPVAWYSVDSSDADELALLRGLARSLSAVLGDVPQRWESVEIAAHALEAELGSEALLVIDDLHAISRTPAEAALERFIDYAPPELSVAAGSRCRPDFNLPRLLVSGTLLEIGSDDLRFRSWEVERLFRDFYREPLPPEDAATLTRRTEGWAAGLQLFHLATQGKPLGERRAALGALDMRWGAAREYLARNVLADLPAELREFLLGTCVLGRLSGQLCDALLGRTGSDRLLEELDRRQIFTYAVNGSGDYRYHEVLRLHLEAALVDRVGEETARAAHRRAGDLLEQVDALPEALRSFLRAEDAEAVRRLLGRGGEQVAHDPESWIALVPTSVVRDDPWLLLGCARRQRAEGRFVEAIETYREAERISGGGISEETCRHERMALAYLLDPTFSLPTGWTALLRSAAMRDPQTVRPRAAGLPGPHGRLVSGVAAVLAGDLDQAITVLHDVREDPETTAAIAAGARVGVAVALLLRGREEGAVEADSAAEEAERCGIPWLARLGRAALALSDRSGGDSEAIGALLASESVGDPWGVALASLLQGWGALDAGEDAAPSLMRACEGFHDLGADVLEAWARAALALAYARAQTPQARRMAREAEAVTRFRGIAAVRTLLWAARLELGESVDAEPEREAQVVIPGRRGQLPGQMRPEPQQVVLKCFGGFSLSIGGSDVLVDSVRPRARQLLHLLALHAGRSVHREVLMEALWPETEPQAGARNLHVALSSLRRALSPDRETDSVTITRDGCAYRLGLPNDASVDLFEFDRALAEGREAVHLHELERSVAAFGRALAVYRELLPEDGPAEWIVAERERRRAEGAEAARRTAEVQLDLGRPVLAAEACERGLQIDRDEDSLWRLCIRAYEEAGEPAAAARTRRGYARALAALGVPA
jgi:DNA-binding SARP family transcriptional activator